ncbi:MAG: hypothetical protein ACRD82_02835, partial [Blastocatellia bacterium]
YRRHSYSTPGKARPCQVAIPLHRAQRGFHHFGNLLLKPPKNFNPTIRPSRRSNSASADASSCPIPTPPLLAMM